MKYKNHIRSIFVLLLVVLSVVVVYSQEVKNKILNDTYLNGEIAFNDYLHAKITYPQKAKKNGLMGLSVLSFKIDCQNMPYDFIFTTKLGYKVEEQIEKVITKTKGNWQNCDQRNQDERIHLKIAFSINFLYSPNNVDCVIDAVSQFKVIEDTILIEKMEKSWKEKDFKKTRIALWHLIKRYPFNDEYRQKMHKIEKN